MCFRLSNRIVALALVGLFLASVALGQMSEADKQWLEKEVAPLVTKEEGELFESLGSDDQRAIFKAIFWARRDPTPSEPGNPFKDNYETRLYVVNRDFKAPGRAGVATDMGQIFLLLGPPRQADPGRQSDTGLSAQETGETIDGSTTERVTLGGDASNPPEMVGGARSPSDEGGFGEGGGTLVQTWEYRPDEGLGIPNGLSVRFRAQPGFGYRLIRDNALVETLEFVKNQYIVNPGLVYERDEQGNLLDPSVAAPFVPASPVLMELRETRAVSTDVSFEVQASFFLSNQGTVYIPILFDIDAASLSWSGNYADAKVVGLLEDSEGTPLYQVDEPAALEKGPDGRTTFEMPLQLPPGQYTVYLGIQDISSSTVGTKIINFEVPAFSGEKLETSSVLMFAEGMKTEEAFASPGQAFVIGGYRFTPKRDRVYAKTDQLSGIFHAYGYALDSEGSPNLSAQYIFFLNGEMRGHTPDEPFISAGPELAATIFDIPLDRFDPGEYVLKIQVTDHVAGKTIAKDIDFILK
jgi:GWxTD domain-containing protein